MQTSQLSFEALLADGANTNLQRKQDQKYGHLPRTMEEALPFYRTLLVKHDEAMQKGDIDAVRSLRREAHDLAYKLNHYEPGIMADEDSPGCVLDRLTRAKKGVVPLWGQSGSFQITLKETRIRIELDGLFGIGASTCTWMGFGIHAVDKMKPFLSDTGYRSFLGIGGSLEPGLTPENFVTAVLKAYVARDLKGRLRKITPLTARKKP